MIVDEGELLRGIEVEATEHRLDARAAMGVALDHLKEIPDYYSRLARMERDAKRYWKGRR